ncbi:pyridoxamine 5'-phosphate oxidase family protein [Saccharomonospora sp. NPDC006951]
MIPLGARSSGSDVGDLPYLWLMTTWKEFSAAAPVIAEVFTRRHTATKNLCMLATLRADGFPRISPIEPRFFEDDLWLVGMPGTTKFYDLGRDPRFCLHTATVESEPNEGDAKLWGLVRDVQDKDVHVRFAEALFEETGFDLRGREFEHLYAADLTGASSLVTGDGSLDITIWRPGEPERLVHR